MTSMNPAWESRWAGRHPRRRHRPPFGPALARSRLIWAPAAPIARRPWSPARSPWPRRAPSPFPGFRTPSAQGAAPSADSGAGGRRAATCGGRAGARRGAAATRLRDHPRVGERTGGVWRPSPGSIYPTVAKLEDEGLVRTEPVDGRRVVRLTEEHPLRRGAPQRAGRRLGRRGPRRGRRRAALWDQLARLRSRPGHVGRHARQIAAASAALARRARRSTASWPSRPAS